MVITKMEFRKDEVIRAMSEYVFAHCNSVCLKVSDKWVIKLLKDGGIELDVVDGCEEEKEGN